MLGATAANRVGVEYSSISQFIGANPDPSVFLEMSNVEAATEDILRPLTTERLPEGTPRQVPPFR